MLSSAALVFDTTSPSAKACATGAGSVGRPSEPRLASPRHGTLTPGRISVGRPHCLIPISVGAVTGRKYHYRLFRSLQTARHRLTGDGLFPLCIFDVILFNRHLSCLQMVAAPPPPCFPFRAEQLTYLCCRLWTCQCSLSRRMSCLHAGKYLEFFPPTYIHVGKAF